MKKTTTLLLFAISLLFLFSNSRCKKSNDDICFDCTNGPKDTLYIEKDFLDYWYAETGSWWVFKRTDTVGVDIYDTMRAVFHKREIGFHHSYGVNAFEYVFIRIEHQENSMLNFGFDFTKIETEKGYTNTIYYFSRFTSPHLNQLHYPFILSNENNYEIEDKIILETPYKNLDNTLLFSDRYDNSVRLYISKNIGISRIELINGEIWELIDCNVIQ
jgi:hypothetical protein